MNIEYYTSHDIEFTFNGWYMSIDSLIGDYWVLYKNNKPIARMKIKCIWRWVK